MKKKKTYWSNKLNIITFAGMMIFLLASLVVSIVLLADIISQYNRGITEYIANYEITFALTFIYIATTLYAIFYAVYLILYFVKKKKIDDESNIKIKSNGLEDKETIKLRKTYDADVIEENAPDTGSPIYFGTQDNKEIEPKPYKKFIRFLLLRQLVYTLILLIIAIGVIFALIVINMILFFVLLGIALALAIFVVVNYFFITPNMMYKRMKTNPLSSSIRIYDDRVEEASFLMSGKEIVYICKFNFSKVKEDEKYLYIKSRNEKAIVGLMINKEKVGEDNVNFVLNKVKNKSR